jgi:hypothetical protein
MPPYAWHDNKKNHNFDAYRYIAASPSHQFTDWEIIALFYSALHYVDSFLDRKHGLDNIQNHGDRKIMVRGYISPINRTYRILYHLSQNARYDDVPITVAELTQAKTCYDTIKKILTPITCSCGHLNLLNVGTCEICGNTLT